MPGREGSSPKNVQSRVELVDDNIRIAVIGEMALGKSVYLASLLHHMKEQWVNSSSLIHMKCLTKDIEEYFSHNYLIPIFGKHRDIPATQPQHETEMHPLIYELTFRAASKNQEKRVNLIFYDGSGQDYALQDRMEQFARYVRRASAIIFLVDPASIPEMSSRLPDHLQYYLGGTATESTAYHFLTSTIELLEEYYPSAFRSMPLAVMLSKSDLLNYVYGPKVPSFKCLEPSLPHLNLQSIRNIDTEVRALIRETCEHPLLDVAQRFSKVSLFASSATGCAKDSAGYYPHIKPCRCLDPLLWILHQRNVIPAGRSF